MPPISSGDQLTVAAVVVGVLAPMMWYLLREIRAAVNGLSREVSDLTLAIAIDVATRPEANHATKRLAEQLVNERDRKRAREIDGGHS